MKKEPKKLSLLERWKNRDKQNQPENLIEKAPKGKRIPLSHGQKRLWFLQQMYPNNAFYNYSETYTFKGNLDVPILIESLKKIYEDHDVLKTTYHIENGLVFQKVNNDSELHVDVYDLSTLTETDKKIKREKIIETNARKYFDLTKTPLLRATLIKTNATEHILQITLHHIITDKWSMRIFREHLAAHYSALSLDNCNFSKKTTLQYTDYAYWQSKTQIDQNNLNYWKNKLSGNIPELNLPTDYSRPIHPTFKGAASSTQRFNKTTSSAILALAQQLETTPYVILLSVYYVFLYRCSGQTDISIGAPITNRDNKALEDIIGFFIDTFVLRTHLAPSMSFIDVAIQVRRNTLEAFANKNMPFDVLVKALNTERSLAINPFFQVMFVYFPELEMPIFNDDLRVTHELVDTQVSKFDLTLFISEENGHLSSTFEYSTELFQESTIKRFQTYFKLLVEGIAANPNQRILELPMLPEPERQFLLNQKKTVSNHFSEFRGIHDIIENISVSYPNRIAVTYKSNAITYKTLNDKANLMAGHLLNHIKAPNEIVGLCLDRSVDMIVAMLAILKSGCAYLPIDPEYPEQRINFMLSDAQVKTIVTQQHFSQIFKPGIVQQLYIDDFDGAVQAAPQKKPDVNESDLAYIIYTSGSTGQPKGVPISHRNIINSTAGRLDFYDENPTAFLLMSSIAFDSSKSGIFWTLCTGGNLVIAEERMEQDVDKIGDLIDRLAISHTLMLPSLYKLILEYVNTKKLKSLKTVIVAGEACYPDLVSAHFSKLNVVKLYNEYGPTEATVWCIAHQIKTADQQSVPIGKPVAGAEIYLLDQHLKPVPFGSVGEIYIGGSGLANGYLNNPELSDEMFVENPFNPSKKLYKTGDLGKYNHDKNIEFLGRADEQIKIRGFRVELSEIEKTIKNYNTSITNAVVLVDEGHDFDIDNMDGTLPTNHLVDILKKMDDNDLDAIFSSINSLNDEEKQYLLNQIEA